MLQAPLNARPGGAITSPSAHRAAWDIRPAFGMFFCVLADRYLYVPLWSADIHAEWVRSLRADRPDIDASVLERTRAVMDGHFSRCRGDGIRGDCRQAEPAGPKRPSCAGGGDSRAGGCYCHRESAGLSGRPSGTLRSCGATEAVTPRVLSQLGRQTVRLARVGRAVQLAAAEGTSRRAAGRGLGLVNAFQESPDPGVAKAGISEEACADIRNGFRLITPSQRQAPRRPSCKVAGGHPPPNIKQIEQNPADSRQKACALSRGNRGRAQPQGGRYANRAGKSPISASWRRKSSCRRRSSSGRGVGPHGMPRHLYDKTSYRWRGMPPADTPTPRSPQV